MAKLDDGFEEVPLELDSGFEEQPLELDEGFEEVSSSSPEEQVGGFEATGRAVGQGLTLGTMDELAGGAMAAADVATSDSELKDLPRLYQAYRDMQRERDKLSEKQHPKKFLGGELAAGVATSFTPAGAANTASKAAKLGGLLGFGKAEGSLGEQATDTAVGAVGGKYLHKGAEELASILSKLKAGKPFTAIGDKMQQQAEDLSLSTLGTNKRTLESEVGQSIFTPKEYRKGIGEEALKMRGVLDKPVDLKVKAANEVKRLEETKKPLLEQAQRGLDGKIMTADISQASENSLNGQLRKLKDEIINREKQTSTNLQSVQLLDQQLEDTIQRYSINDNNIFKLNEFKKLLGEKLSDVQFKKVADELPQEAEFIRKTYSLVKQRIEDLADQVEPGLGQKIKAINARESNLIDLGQTARDAQLREIGQSSKWDPRDVIGNQLDKAKILSAKGLSKSGEQISNVGKTIESPSLGNALSRGSLQDVYSKATQEDVNSAPVKLSQNLYEANDEQLYQVADTLGRNDQYANYGEALKRAMEEKSNDRKNAALFTILQNPNMRKLIYGEEVK